MCDVYAHEYDLMTNAAARESYHAREVAALAEAFKPTSVLDAGCATGLTAMLFARLGVAATGLDRSRKMISLARGKYGASGRSPVFRVGQFESLPGLLHGRFDLVVCLANAISGVGSVANLRKSLRNFCRVLKPGGALVLQMLNYAALKEGEVMPVRATRSDGIIWVRYSIRRGRKLALHAVRLDIDESPPLLEPFYHELDNFTVERVTQAMRSAGFRQLHRYADLLLSKRFTKSARDLVIVTRRPAGRQTV
ncbi:MAG TPA: class I SAM-dependent methyltransferase [Acidobacteriota bacterium]|nr:class I SAM-dependent methyltransferase [Acidobacteriota bacterium]